MKVLHFDCFAGISGDMVIGAFLDLGVEIEYLDRELAKLKVPGFRIEAEKTNRHGISGTLFHVITDETVPPHHHDSENLHVNHDHTHSHYNTGGHSHHIKEQCSGHVHRSYADIKRIITASALD